MRPNSNRTKAVLRLARQRGGQCYALFLRDGTIHEECCPVIQAKIYSSSTILIREPTDDQLTHRQERLLLLAATDADDIVSFDIYASRGEPKPYAPTIMAGNVQDIMIRIPSDVKSEDNGANKS